MVTALSRKLARDLRRMTGQALTIALIIACGIASYIALKSAYASLLNARDAYYTSQRLADVFAHVKRAPEPVAARIEAIPGVAVVETRLVEPVTIPIEGKAQPASGRLVSLPRSGESALNAIVLRRGRMIDPATSDEVIVLESFADAHRMEPGAVLAVVMNGTLIKLRVVGIALSPEYVMAVGGGATLSPDAERFAVLFMARDAIAPAFGLAGAFDDVSLRLKLGASEESVREQLDRILEPYGGTGSIPRRRQPSAFFVDGELMQLGTYASFAPAIFLGVAAFLVNVVLARLVHIERPQIATLAALGYGRRAIAAHYLSLVLVIVGFGSIAGVALGAWLGRGMLGLYTPYFRFPSLDYRLEPSVVATSVLVSFAAAIAGAASVVIRVMKLSPAQAMSPEAPPTYTPTWIERAGLTRLLSCEGRMVARDMLRRPLRTALSAFGIACGVGVVVTAGFTYEALDLILDLQFETAQREDLTVTFTRPMPATARSELSAIPGVLMVEPLRVVPVRLRAGHRSYDTSITGHPEGAELRRVVGWPRRVVTIEGEGLTITDALAKRLAVTPGDAITVEVLEGDRRSRDVIVTATAPEMFGLNAHMDLRALHALVDEAPSVNAVLLRIDPSFAATIDARLARLPEVASIDDRHAVIDHFKKQSAESMRVMSVVLTLFGVSIAVAIVYNNARIALSTRGRDLASMRVLGFTRREISTVLVGELGATVALAIVPGLAFGEFLVVAMMQTADPEMYRLPVVITNPVRFFAAAVTVAAALASALVVRRKLDALDLVAVLKARE